MRLLQIITISLLISCGLNAQSLSEGLRYADLRNYSTASAAGIGGGLSALGGDFSTASANPAGMATYRNSQVNLGLSFLNNAIEARFGESRTNSKKTLFSINSLGYVSANRPIASNWKTVNFGIGINQIANFNRKYEYEGNTAGSIVERFVERANGIDLQQLDDFEAYPAYAAQAIYDQNEDDFYESDFGDFTQIVPKRQSLSTTGGINEIVLNMSANYNDLFSIGGGIGIPTLIFEQTKEYNELDEQSSIEYFDELVWEEYLKISGAGINGKIGVIFHPGTHFRIGGSYQTKTKFFLKDDYSNTLSYAYTDANGSQSNTASSPDGQYDYRITTPARLKGSLAYLFAMGKLRGFFTLESELVQYGGMNFDLTVDDNAPDGALTDEINTEIDNDLRSATNYRLGMELGSKVVKVRLGYGENQSPYIGNSDLQKFYSFGFGFKFGNWNIDLATVTNEYSENYSPYFILDSNRQPEISIDGTATNVIMSIGLRL